MNSFSAIKYAIAHLGYRYFNSNDQLDVGGGFYVSTNNWRYCPDNIKQEVAEHIMKNMIK